MNKHTAWFLWTVGFFLTAFGVGGIEQSMDNAGLYAGVLVSVVGLMTMGCGTLMMKQLGEI
jgi:hypothetical protein